MAVQVFRGPFLSAEEAEVAAIRKACELAVRMGWKRIELETDCQNLAAEWNGNTGAISWQTEIYIERIRSNLCLFFDSFDLHWIPRKCNYQARNICKWGLRKFLSSGAFCSSPEWELLYTY